MGHCGRKNIRISWIFVKTALVLNYFGQGAYLIHHEGETLQSLGGKNGIDLGFVSNGYLLQSQEWRDSYDERDTDIPVTEFSRHYEATSVAKQLLNGKWVGYTYWYGGGKHGEPQAMPWIEDAYFLDCREEMIVSKIFTKSE
jgi:hypothetical protein